MLRLLDEKAMVTYSEKMGKWELTTIGRAILAAIDLALDDY